MHPVPLAVIVALCTLGCSLERPAAGIIDDDNADSILLRGPLAAGTIGDYFLRNDRLVAIVQKPGRIFGPGPYGGNLIDVGATERRDDPLNEAIPFMQLGLTANFTSVRVVDDGSAGGPAVIEAEGEDAIWDFINIQTLSPLLRYETDENGNAVGLLKFDPSADLPLSLRARYSLGKHDTHVEARYFIRNTGAVKIDLHPGFAIAMPGAVEPFTPGRGFDDPGVDLSDPLSALTMEMDTPFMAYQGDGYALGVHSVDFLDAAAVKRLAVGVVGMAVVMVGDKNLLSVLDVKGPLVLAPGEERGLGFDLVLGRDVGDVRTWVAAKSGDPTAVGELQGTVVERGGGAVPGARVALLDLQDGDVLLSFVADRDGRFGGKVPAGSYHIAADDLARLPDPGRQVTITAGAVTSMPIELAPPGHVAIEVQSANAVDQSALAFTPCRLLLIGQGYARDGGLCGPGPCTGNVPFRHGKRFELGAPTPYAAHLLHCSTGLGPEAALAVVPGKYLAVVSRGPEYDTVVRLLDVAAGATVTVAGVLHRVVDSKGYVAGDFHVHQLPSLDSVVELEQRLASVVAAGIEFFATTDHDVVSDLRPLVALLGLTDQVETIPGVEVSTIDLGHFNGYPIEPRAGMQNGDPPDWAGGRARPSPGELFDRMRLRGAEVVQVNHPRMRRSYFDAIGMKVDLEGGTIYHDPRVAPSPELMHMAPGSALFSPNFDTLEIYNGLAQGSAEAAMRDWFNLLSMGLRPTGVAVSDTHGVFNRNPGEPRTYIAAKDDRPPFASVSELLQNLKAGHVFGSSGPQLTAVLSAGDQSATFGDLLTPATLPLRLDIHVETATWYGVSAAEIFITQTYADQSGDSSTLALSPTLTLPLAGLEVTRANGGVGKIYDASVDLDALQLPEGDGWIVVRVRGVGWSLYPVCLSGGNVTFDPAATTPETFAVLSGGSEPFAFGNPIFFDRNANGVYDPPFPMR
ncbi:MAG: CehA/McbA family metallohydrolase [Deltaproteobacteria bacterium]|nr:CehA/McbA family metallohydrolase [Deltaproteobacteria bacterium]